MDDAGPNPSRDGVRAATLRSFAELEPIEDFWRSCHGHRDAHPDFFRFVFDTNPAVSRPHVVAVYRGAVPVALLLGRLEYTAIGAKIGYLRVPVPRLRLINFIYGGRLGDATPAFDALMADEILAALKAGEADAAMLHFIPESSPLHRLARDIQPFWRRDHVPDSAPHYLMGFPPAPDGLLKRLPAKEQSNHKRRQRRFEREFGSELRIDCWESEADVPRLCEAAETVAARSYQRGLGVGFSDTAEMRQRLVIEARHGALRGFVLSVKDKPWAFWIVSYRGGVIYNDFLAYDPVQARYAPGMFLVVAALERLCRTAPAGAELTLDFGMGAGEWKESWGDRYQTEATVFIFGGSWRALSSNLIRTIANAIARALRGALRRTKLLSEIKRRWRRGSRRESPAADS